jgi:hypothetical protein
MLIYLLYACLLAFPLLAIAWSRSNRLPVEFSILSLSALLFVSAAIRNVKLTLLGSDYSDRLFTTIGVNILVAIIIGVYLGVKRRWIGAIAALLLAFGWLVVGAVNSAV